MPRYYVDDKESGDAKFHISEEQTKSDKDHKTVSEQRIDFADFMKNKKSPRPTQESGDVSENIGSENKCVVSWKPTDLEEDDEDDFQKILKTTCPQAERTATLLDQVMELRSELEARVKELGKFKEDLRAVGQHLSLDPFKAAEMEIAAPGQQAAALQHRLYSLCGQLESQGLQPPIDEM